MKALVITAQPFSVEPAEIAGLEDIQALIGYPTLESDEIDANGDRLYFDEECFLRGTQGRFRVDNLAPVAGVAVVVGSQDDALADVATPLAELVARVTCL